MVVKPHPASTTTADGITDDAGWPISIYTTLAATAYGISADSTIRIDAVGSTVYYITAADCAIIIMDAFFATIYYKTAADRTTIC